MKTALSVVMNKRKGQLYVETRSWHYIWHFVFIWSGKFDFYQGKIKEFWKEMSVPTMKLSSVTVNANNTQHPITLNASWHVAKGCVPNAHNMLRPTRRDMLQKGACQTHTTRCAQHVATCCRRVLAKRTQHVASNNVAICCVDVLRSFGQGLRETNSHITHYRLSYFFSPIANKYRKSSCNQSWRPNFEHG